MSSFQNVLPPSMMVSPAESRPVSSAIAAAVGSPAGSISQTARGAASRFTKSCRATADRAPSRPSARPASRLAVEYHTRRGHGASAAGRCSRPCGPVRQYRPASSCPPIAIGNNTNQRVNPPVTIQSARYCLLGSLLSSRVAQPRFVREPVLPAAPTRRAPYASILRHCNRVGRRRHMTDVTAGTKAAASRFPASGR